MMQGWKLRVMKRRLRVALMIHGTLLILGIRMILERDMQGTKRRGGVRF
jgi:hypothetical protein